MLFRLLADIIVILHFGFILFVVCGGVLALRWRAFIWLHLPAVLWGVIIEWSGWICPLTPLENLLRYKAGQTVYSGGFVEHYILPIIYPDFLTRKIQIVIGILVILINLIIYVAVWKKNKKKSPKLPYTLNAPTESRKKQPEQGSDKCLSDG